MDERKGAGRDGVSWTAVAVEDTRADRGREADLKAGSLLRSRGIEGPEVVDSATLSSDARLEDCATRCARDV